MTRPMPTTADLLAALRATAEADAAIRFARGLGGGN